MLCVVDLIHPGRFNFGNVRKISSNCGWTAETVVRVSFDEKDGNLFDHLYEHLWIQIPGLSVYKL